MICAGLLRERLKKKQKNAYVVSLLYRGPQQIPSTAVTLPPPQFFPVLPFSPLTNPFKGMLVVTIRRLELVRTLQKYTEM